jgi:hypothetical protein
MKIFSAQLKGTTIVVSGSSASITGSFTGSIAGIDINETNQFTASTIARLSSIETISSSNDSRVNSLEAFSSSIFTTNTFTSSTSARLNSIETITASNISRLTSLESTSASVDTLNTTQNTRLTSLEIKTGSLATTGSNTFIGTQTITGSLFISSDLIVQGSSSLQNITASAVSIGTNIVNLNTANPAIRYAGLSIGDSGSIGSSGSFLYDSVQDEMIFIHRGANSTVTSSVTLMGPQTYDNIGSEIYPTSNYIQKGTGNEHLVDSCIIDNGSTICFNTPTASFSGQLGVGASNPRWALEVCRNNGCTGAGQYPGISINNGCTTGYSGLYFYNGLTQMGGMETSNSTGNILVNSQAGLSLQTAGTNRISIANTGATTLSCELYLDGCRRDTVFVKSNNVCYSRLFYAGNNAIVFHNGGAGGQWGLNNYEDTVGLFRVYNSGASCWYGDKMVCGNIGINCTSAKFYQLTNNCKSADSVLDIYNTATNGFGVSIQAGANNNNYALAVTNFQSTPLLYVAGNGQVGIGCGTPNAKLTINSGNATNSVNIYGSNSSYISQLGWYDSTNVNPAGDGVGGQRVALIEIGTVAGSGTGCRGANMALYTHEANGSLKLPLFLTHTGNICFNGNLYTTCTLFAPGTPIQIASGTATFSSGNSGQTAGLGSAVSGVTPAFNGGCVIASISFTPKSASSKLLIQTNNVAMWETANVSDHFYIWASNDTAGNVLTKAGAYLPIFGSGNHGAIINLNGTANSWGTSSNTISFRVGTTGGTTNYQYNPFYGAGGFNSDTVGHFSYTIMEIAQ